LVGADPRAQFEALEPQPGISNYFIGNDPSKWRTEIPHYGRVALRGVYPGIDLVFYGNPHEVEYDWVVAAGADARQIRVRWESDGKPRMDSNGDLVIGGLRQKKPDIRQGGQQIEGGYKLRGREVSFKLARCDARKPLTIDPVLYYSTYLGGNGEDW